VFICCYFDQEDRDCVGVQKTHALFHSDFSHKVSFCGEFSQKFLGRQGVLEVTPGQKGWLKLKLCKLGNLTMSDHGLRGFKVGVEIYCTNMISRPKFDVG
jgi:hypothetical protein